ncbi:hypothetical protein [Pseudoalteromonas aurantia]|uniref:Uncharacterized protein n=1 Tax=Pseudoalteromonas aurantia 208 TaxID=1314867 RepID=A0ABR9EBY9_9GAMM|nr:hypothetical protein [Pseudoalteromonas aurantia]MBE0368504.1 hypothetical protein [Pseudoalteromonas aurantia 208]
MKVFTIALLFIAFNLSAKEERGVVVKILPDPLTLDSSCKAMADLVAQDFSILYACKDSFQRMYFYNFRLNNIDLVADFKKSSTDVVVNKSQFKSYTLYELTAKNPDNKPIKFVSYCTKELCLDLVSDNEYEKSVQDSITSQLRG